MVKSNKVKIYNNSESTFQVTEGEKDPKTHLPIIITIPPKTSIELSEKEAKRLLNNYPKDFLEGGSVQDQAKGLKEKDQRIVELEATIETMKKQATDEQISEIGELREKLEVSEKAKTELNNDVAKLKVALETSEVAKEKAKKEAKDLNDLIDSAQAEVKAPTNTKPGTK